jgi:hypothetical protein
MVNSTLPEAKIEDHKVGDRVYRGASPVYYNAAEQGKPPHFVKVAKGVPWKRVK